MVGWKPPAFYCRHYYRSLDLNWRTAWSAALLCLSTSFFLVPLFSLADTPSTVGQWSAVTIWPYKPIHAHLLPSGKVLFWPRADTPKLWDPATNVFSTVPQAGANIFCSGHTFLSDGRLLVAGGHVQSYFGIPNAYTYKPSTNSWTRLPNMNAARWYPTAMTLPNSDVLVISGQIDTTDGMNAEPQVWQSASASWRNLSTAHLILPYYPFMYVAPNGKVFMAGPNQLSRYLDVSGIGAWSSVANNLYGNRNWASSVTYDTGKVLVMGGSTCNSYSTTCTTLPTKTAEIIDLNSSTPTWKYTGSMAYARRLHNATLLADGKVLVSGGSSGSEDPNSNSKNPAYVAEMWDPATGTWSTMASLTVFRGYHSTALLLPDGRVLSGGGETVTQPSAEIYSPPYLFKGARPTISSAPTSVDYGQSFFVGTPDGTSITKVTLIALSSVTHGFNMAQRISRPAFSQGSGGLNVTAPSSRNTTPPGYYMLFILNSTGVPSVAKILQIGSSTSPTPTPTPSPTPTPTPAVPTNLAATAASSTQINLSWIDNSASKTGFEIERSSEGTTFMLIATVGAGINSYASTGLLPATKYSYRVRAYNSGGNSVYSNIASATTQPAPTPTLGLPAAPTNLAASALGRSGHVNLSWRDNSSNETGFQIERSTDGSTFRVLAKTAPNVTSYRDSSGAKRQRYYYRVCAKNKAGLSAYSNIAVKP
jgi:hypothetical protein